MVSKTFRFKIIHGPLYEEMKSFASFHKFENREDLKNSYTHWLKNEDIQQYIDEEKHYLTNVSYDFTKESLETKIYKSIKYYLIKKELATMVGGMDGVKEDKKQRKKTTLFSKELIMLTKRHIQSWKDNRANAQLPPSQCFDNFEKVHENDIAVGFSHHEEDITLAAYKSKLKKMYKNQYFHS